MLPDGILLAYNGWPARFKSHFKRLKNDRFGRLTRALSQRTIVLAYGREQLRDPEYLHAVDQRVNQEAFGGHLPDAELRREDLSAEDAAGHTTREDGRFIIVLDPTWNRSESENRRTVQHEACHAATWSDAENFDFHGPEFRECMERFKKP